MKVKKKKWKYMIEYNLMWIRNHGAAVVRGLTCRVLQGF